METAFAGETQRGGFKLPLPLLVLILTLISTSTYAEDRANDRLETGTLPRYVGLTLPKCEQLPFERSRLTEVLQIELLGDGVGFAQGSVEAEALLIVDAPECPSEDHVFIGVEVIATGRNSRRDLQLEGGPGQERIIALALAELLRREWVVLSTRVDGEAGVEAEFENETEIEPTEDDLSTQETEAVEEIIEQSQPEVQSEEAESRFRLDLQADGRFVSAFRKGLIGARLGLFISPRVQWLRVEADLGGWYGIAVDPLGSIDLLNITGGLSVLFGSRIGSTFTALGPRVEFGWAWARGRPNDEGTLDGSVNTPYLLLALYASFRIIVSQRIDLLINSTMGYIVVGLEAQADERVAAGMKGLVLGLGLGVSVRP